MYSDLKSRAVLIRQYLGRKVLAARHHIYKMARPIGGVNVEELLKPTSSVPTQVYDSRSLALT